MQWRVAACLEVLLEQVNRLAPGRSKVSDGAIGDAAHAATTSDHNPRVKGAGGLGIVTARDITHDPADGCDCDRLADSLVASRDKRIKYVIWNRRIWEPATGWRPYKGANPHDHHLHLSVQSAPALYDLRTAWALDVGKADPRQPKPLPVLRRGDDGDAVKALQRALGVTVDGKFGPVTDKALREFQRGAGIVADGLFGPQTRAALLPAAAA